jgi:hypothetical protein
MFKVRSLAKHKEKLMTDYARLMNDGLKMMRDHQRMMGNYARTMNDDGKMIRG